MTNQPIVVGVDDTAASRSAVLWAAEEAVLASTQLLIVHSPEAVASARTPDDLGVALHARNDVALAILDGCVALARAHQPSVVVRPLLSQAEPAQALIDVSAEARLLVLGSPRRPMGDMSLLASKRALVSARAHCPVVLLGPVSTFSRPRGVSRMVAGVADTPAGRAASAFATAEAIRRNVSLRLVHLESPVKPRPSGMPTRSAADSGLSAGFLTAEASAIRGRHPHLEVIVEHAQAEPAEVLPGYTDSSTILVIGCRHENDRWSTRLGPVATSVVQRNRGAVVVVGRDGEPRAEPADGLWSRELRSSAS